MEYAIGFVAGIIVAGVSVYVWKEKALAQVKRTVEEMKEKYEQVYK